jgi:hypothetical protein
MQNKFEVCRESIGTLLFSQLPSLLLVGLEILVEVRKYFREGV